MELVLDSAYVANESGSYVEGCTEAGDSVAAAKPGPFRGCFAICSLT